MKVYMQMFKYNFKMMPKISISLLIMMVSVTIYKLFFLEFDKNLFSMDNITIAQIVFRLIFIILVMGIYGQIFLFFRESLTTNIFQMIPNIRKKALIFGFLNLFLVYFWAVFILGFNHISVIIFFTMLNLWFLSSCMTLYFFDIVPIYRSNRFWILKMIFAILSFMVPMLSSKSPSKHPITYFIIISFFLIVVLYQIINFICNYIDFRLKEDFNVKGFGLKMNSLQNIMDNINVWKCRKTIGSLKIKAVRDRYGKLIHFTLFGNEFIFPWIFIGTISG
ncbi:MAG: hypothetical protein KKD38_01730, partial [Candidatus Delongbacteria bacterium]|nr:hypothetical protein [Candidatus Delongbacteria bacterium]